MGLFEHWPYVNFHELNLNWMLDEMKAIDEEVKKVQELAAEMEELKDEYEKILELYEQLQQEFIEFEAAMNSRFFSLETELRNQISTDMAAVRAEINQFKNSVNQRLDGFDSQLTALDRKVDNAIEHLADYLTMVNPFTGVEEPIAQVIGVLASFHMEDAITAGEYDGLHLTASHYDGLGLTAYQYDVTAKQYLMP